MLKLNYICTPGKKKKKKMETMTATKLETHPQIVVQTYLHSLSRQDRHERTWTPTKRHNHRESRHHLQTQRMNERTTSWMLDSGRERERLNKTNIRGGMLRGKYNETAFKLILIESFKRFSNSKLTFIFCFLRRERESEWWNEKMNKFWHPILIRKSLFDNSSLSISLLPLSFSLFCFFHNFLWFFKLTH